MRLGRGSAIAAIAISAFAESCFTTGHTPSPGPSEADVLAGEENASAEYAAAFCAARMRCAPTAFEDDFHDIATCTERYAISVLRSHFAEGSTTTADDLRTCTRGLDLSTCNGFNAIFERNTPPECVRPGSFTVGDTCLYDRQCASTYCQHRAAPSLDCGVCAAQVPIGAACVDTSGCALGSGCLGHVCTPYVDRGQGCGAEVGICHLEEACINGQCVARLAQDEPCDVTVDECQLSPVGLVCSTSPPRCEPYVTDPLGGACGALPDSSEANCAHGSRCRGLEDVDGAHGTCVGTIPDGAASYGLWLFDGGCMSPAIPFFNRCLIPDASLCGDFESPP